MILPWHLVNVSTGEAIATALELADTFWARFKGLQLRRRLPPGHGLLLVPCPSIHTFMVRFPIDVVLLDRGGRVVAVRRGVRPWRVVLPVRGAYAALELPGDATRVQPGEILRLQALPGVACRLPASTAFLWETEASGGR